MRVTSLNAFWPIAATMMILLAVGVLPLTGWAVALVIFLSHIRLTFEPR